MRSTPGRVALVLGALALLGGATACTGGDGNDAPTDRPSEAQETTDPGDDGATGDDADGDGSDGGGRESGSYDQTELDAAAERLIAFLRTLDDSDFEAACRYLADPATGEPFGDDELGTCASDLEQSAPEVLGVPLEPGTFDALDSSMVTVVDNGDGTASPQFMGEEFEAPMSVAGDGQWYILFSR